MRALAVVFLGLVGCGAGTNEVTKWSEPPREVGGDAAGGAPLLVASSGSGGSGAVPAATGGSNAAKGGDGGNAGSVPWVWGGGGSAAGSGGRAGASSLGSGGQGAGAGGTAASGAPSAGTGGAMGGGGSSAGAGQAGTANEPSTAPKECSLPAGGPGSICGGACGYSFDSHPAGYGYPSPQFDDGLCTCAAREVEPGTFIDVRGDGDVCTPTNLNDGPVRARYTINGAQCARIWADWKGWSIRVIDPSSTNKLFDGCTLVRGSDYAGNLPVMVVEVFGKGDAYVRVEAVDCNFPAGAQACQ